MIINYISSNPGFLFLSLVHSKENKHNQYNIFYKDNKIGGAWNGSDCSNLGEQYNANHFLCTTHSEKLKRFLDLNNKYVSKDIKLIEIKNKFLEKDSMYKDYKFYNLNISFSEWIKLIIKKIINQKNISLHQNTNVESITIKGDSIYLETEDVTTNTRNLYKCNKLLFTLNTYINSIKIENTDFLTEKKQYVYKHIFFKSSKNLPYDLMLINNSNFSIIQSLSFLQEKLNVLRLKNHNKCISLKDIESYIKCIDSSIQITDLVKETEYNRNKIANYEILKTKLNKYSNITFISEDTSVLDNIIFRYLD